MNRADIKIINDIKALAGGSVNPHGKGWRWRKRQGNEQNMSVTGCLTATTLPELFERVKERESRITLKIQEEKRVRTATTVGDLLTAFIAEFEREVEAGDKAPNTLRFYRQCAEHIEVLKHRRITDLTFQEVYDWHNCLESKSGKAVALLSRLLDDAGDPLTGVAKGYVNPLTVRGRLHKKLRGKPTVKGSRGGQFVTPVQWRLIENYLRECVVRPAKGKANLSRLVQSPSLNRLRFLIGTGVRLSELQGIQLGDFIVRHGVLHVKIQRQSDGKGGLRPMLKTDAAGRLIPLMDTAVIAYEERRAQLAALGHSTPDTILFGHDDGETTLSGSALSDALERACRALELDRISPHNLRGTAMNWLLTKNPNMPLHVFCRYGGWSSFEVARKHYLLCHPDSDMAVKNLDLNLSQTLSDAADAEENQNVIQLFPGVVSG